MFRKYYSAEEQYVWIIHRIADFRNRDYRAGTDAFTEQRLLQVTEDDDIFHCRFPGTKCCLSVGTSGKDS